MSNLSEYKLLHRCYFTCSSKNKSHYTINTEFQMVKILSASLPFFFHHKQLTEVWMLPECHLLVLMGRYSFGSHYCTQVLLNRGSAFDKSHNLFPICCFQVLLVVMLIFPNNLGLSVIKCFTSGLAFLDGEDEVLKCNLRF